MLPDLTSSVKSGQDRTLREPPSGQVGKLLNRTRGPENLRVGTRTGQDGSDPESEVDWVEKRPWVGGISPVCSAAPISQDGPKQSGDLPRRVRLLPPRGQANSPNRSAELDLMVEPARFFALESESLESRILPLQAAALLN